MLNANAQIALLDPRGEEAKQLSDMLSRSGAPVVLLNDIDQLFELANQSRISGLVINAQRDQQFLDAALRQRTLSIIDCPFIVLVDPGAVPLAVAAARQGAADVLTLPGSEEQLLERLLELNTSGGNNGFTCEAEQSRQLVMLAERVAATDVTVLINGDSGTGKEVLARQIHQCSNRNTQAFVALNCASIPESMLEDMLFGHEKGAFTGAHQSHQGLFEQANGGTLFLDEIGEMPIMLQAKILRVLQERELQRLGGAELIKLDVRVIAATNRDLAQRVREREFREDLFYRLNVFPLKITPLRERVEDILPIARVLMQKHRKSIGNRCRLSKATQQFLKAYPWPGNVRELENVLQRAMVLAFDGVIEIEHLLLEGDLSANLASSQSVSTQSTPEHTGQATAAVSSPAPVAPESAPEPERLDEPTTLSDLAWESESRMIINTLSRNSGNRKSTAETLGISPRTLRYKLAKLKNEGVAIP